VLQVMLSTLKQFLVKRDEKGGLEKDQE
jgi:hypothetical protein